MEQYAEGEYLETERTFWTTINLSGPKLAALALSHRCICSVSTK